MPLWFGPNWKEEKSQNRSQTGTMLKSQKNWDEDGNHFQVSFKHYYVVRLIASIVKDRISNAEYYYCHSASYISPTRTNGMKKGQ